MANTNWLKKRLDFDSFDDKVQRAIDEWDKSPNKGFDTPLIQELCNKSRDLIDEYIGEHEQDECSPSTSCGKGNLEALLWMLGLTCLSWVGRKYLSLHFHLKINRAQVQTI